MKILGWEVNNTHIVIVVGAVFGGGACYALLKYLTRDKNPRRKSISGRRGRGRDGDPDLDLPLILEHEYGNFRRICQEADPIASRYLHEIPDHFFTFQETFTRFIADITTKHATRYRQALVIGSGTGCLVFRLARIFDEVKGIEKSFSQVVTCYQFQNLNTVNFFFPAEGSLKTVHKAVRSPLLAIADARKSDGKKKNRKENIEFINADFDNQLPSEFGEFQVVIIRNCLEELEDPQSFLSSLKGCVEIDGLLIISSGYDWKRRLNQTTGFQTPDVTNSFELLKHILKEHFMFIDEKNIPDIICESVRSCRMQYNHVTAWIRINDVPNLTKNHEDKV